MISLPLWIGSGSPADIERTAFVGSDAPGREACICNARTKRVPARGVQAADQRLAGPPQKHRPQAFRNLLLRGLSRHLVHRFLDSV
jgi:hypothetical protein